MMLFSPKDAPRNAFTLVFLVISNSVCLVFFPTDIVMSADEKGDADGEDDEEELLLPPNLIWKLALLVHNSGVTVSTSREAQRFKVLIHPHGKGALETYHVNFRDFQMKLYDQTYRLPDPYEYFDHVGSYFVQENCLFLEVHFTSEAQMRRCLDGIEGAGLVEKVNNAFRVLMGAKQASILFKLKLVVCSSIDQKFRHVCHENANYAYELVYTQSPAFSTVHIRDKDAYRQIKKSYNELLKLFPGFFGGTTEGSLEIAESLTEISASVESNVIAEDSDIDDKELAEIAEKVLPKRWQVIGLHLGLHQPQLDRLEMNNKGNVLTTIIKMLGEAKKCSKPSEFRKVLSVALYQSHQHDLALAVYPSLKVEKIPSKVSYEEESPKLCLVHGELRFYDKGLAENFLSQIFWSKMKDKVVPFIGERLAPYSIQTGLVDIGSLNIKVALLSFTGCLRLAVEISNNAFVLDVETSLKAVGYKESLLVDFNINGVHVTPENCYSLYMEELNSSMLQLYQSLPAASGEKGHRAQGKVKKFRRVLNSEGPPTSIVGAIKRNDSSAVRSFLSQGVKPNDCIDGHAPLHTASVLGKHEIVEILVDNGAIVDIRTATEEHYTPLHLAAHSGHIATVKTLVNLGAEVDSLSRNGRTPLRLATAEGYANIAEFLLSKSADPNAQDSVAATPLHAAAGLNRKSAVEVLIDGGGDITIPDNEGSTPIHEAIKTGDIDLLKLVLLRNPSVVDKLDFKAVEPPLTAACKMQNVEVIEFLLTEVHARSDIENKDHLTPLSLACALENMKIIELLVNHGASPKAISPHFGSVLHLSAKEGKVRATEKLLELGVPCDLRDNDSYTPLRDAVRCKRHGTVRVLLNRGASIRAGTPPGKLPLLHVAARNNDVEMLEILLQHNCDIYETPPDGSTAFHHAASCGKSEAIHFLCSQSALLNGRSVAGLTPLYTAVRQRNFDSAMEILVYDPDVNICSHKGHSPLLICIEFNGPVELVEQLVLHKAKIHYPYELDLMGKAMNLRSPIQLAVSKGQAENVKVLLQANPDFLQESLLSLHHLLLFSAIDSNSETLRVLLDNGVNPNALTNNESFSAIVKACFNGGTEMLKLLLDYGGDAGMPCGDMGITPLIVACEHDKIELVEILVTKVDVNQQLRSNGYAPLHKMASDGNPEIAVLLLNNGAIVDKESHDGLTPLHVAASAGNMDVIDILLRYKANINAQDSAKTTPLIRAVQDRRRDAAVKLIDAGANAEICAINGIHVLHFAAHLDDVKTIELLAQKGIDLNTKDANGISPLHIATLKGNTSAVEALLSCGAIADIQNNDGFTPLHLAVNNDNVEIAELLMDKGASINVEVEGKAPTIFSKSPKMNQLFQERGSQSQGEELPIKKEQEESVTEQREVAEHGQKQERPASEQGSNAKSVQSMKRVMDDLSEQYNVLLPAC